MRSGTAAGRMRLVISLAVLSAAAVLVGLILVVMSTAAHVVSSRPAGHVTVLGLALGAAGIAVGLVTLLMVAFSRPRRSTRGQGGSRVAGPPPWPSHQPGSYAAGPGWGPPPAPPQQPRPPQQPVGPPHDRMRAREAYPPRHALPPREALPSREAPPSREVPPSFRPGYPRQFGRGQESQSGRPPAGPGHAPSGRPWPAPPGTPPARPAGTSAGPMPPGARRPGASRSAARTGSRAAPNAAGPSGTFDGGYAQVIRAMDDPARPDGRTRPPHPGRPAGPARPGSPAPADADVFVYRDSGTRSAVPPAGSPARDPAEHDTAYWYDLLTEDTALRGHETRGPFEPLQSSRGMSSGPGGAATGTEPDGTGPGQASSDDMAQARARKLEQLKDLYLTAEAIGEENVDKHFDQLLAQQRELISEYFRESAVDPDRPGGPGATGRRAGNPEGAGAAAEQPRTW